jgi:hypothetical protein
MSLESDGGMILTGEDRRTRRKTCPSATLSTTNPTWIDPDANPGLRGERPATNHLSHGTASCYIYQAENRATGYMTHCCVMCDLFTDCFSATQIMRAASRNYECDAFWRGGVLQSGLIHQKTLLWRRRAERRYSSYLFMTSALDGGERSESRPGRALPPGKGPPVPIVKEAGWAPGPVWTQRLEEKFSCLSRGLNLDQPVVQSVDRHYTDWATRLLFCECTILTLWRRSLSKCYLRIQSVPQREHHTSPLQRSTG